MDHEGKGEGLHAGPAPDPTQGLQEVPPFPFSHPPFSPFPLPPPLLSTPALSFPSPKPPILVSPSLSLYPEAPDEALDLMSKMLHWDPSKRPTAAEALAHPWFDDVREVEFEKASSVAIDWGRLETMKMSKQNLQVTRGALF